MDNGRAPDYLDHPALSTCRHPAREELTDIVSVRQWLTSADDIAAYAAVRSEVIKHEPAFMLGVISGLVWPALRVEIEVTAVRPSRP